MKRDDDLIRQLLFEAEASDKHVFLAVLYLNSKQEETRRHYHSELLCDAGLFTGLNDGVYRMTNQGHDYLDAIRSDTIWNKTKDGSKKVGGMSLNMMKDLAIAYIKQEAAEKLGVKL